MKHINFLLISLILFTFQSAFASGSKGYFDINIERVDQASSLDSIQLRGTLTARKDFSSIKVSWNLPKDIEVLGGQTTINAAIQKGESQTYDITIRSRTTENRKINFVVHETIENDGAKIGASASYNTNPDRSADSSPGNSELAEQNKVQRESKTKSNVLPLVKKKKPKRIIQ